MSKKLKLAADLELPIDAVTQTFLIVGKRGSGKSNTAARFVEQLHHARLPFVVLDPVDTWWGLKAARDGGRGLDVYVFGGRKQDLPLESTSGALIAETLCEHRISMVLSVKHLSGRERSAFMVAFAQTLFQKWQGGPLHVVLEEAHELAPQLSGGRGGNNSDNEAAMLGAFKRLWKLGRASGIGGSAITQRPASLSKDITTQSEILIAHRTIGPQDVAAIGQWVKYHGEQEQILADLPTLPTGDAFVWAPEFPEGKPLGLRRATVLLRETYDSASTPKVGEQRIEPKELAAVDLERLRTKMAATIERAKADDPRELRKALADKDKRIKELEKASSGSPTSSETKKTEHVPVLTQADRDVLARAADRLDAMIIALSSAINPDTILGAVTGALADLFEQHKHAQAELFKFMEGKRLQVVTDKVRGAVLESARTRVAVSIHPPNVAPATRAALMSAAKAVVASTNGAASGLTHGQQAILDMTLAIETRGIPRSVDALCAWLDLHPNGGTFRGNLKVLRDAGLLDGFEITDAGRAAARALPTGLDAAKAKLTNGQVTILGALEQQSKPVDVAMLGELLGLHPNGGTFRGNIARLRDMGLITGGAMRVTEAAYR